MISPYMTATMAGFGAAGYRLAVEGAVEWIVVSVTSRVSRRVANDQWWSH